MNSPTPRVIAARGLRGLIAPEFDAGASALGLDQCRSFDRAMKDAIQTTGGRSDNYLLSSPLWPGRVRVRPLRRGGLLAALPGVQLFSRRRSQREFDVWRALEANGTVLPPVAFAIGRRRGLLWTQCLATLNLEHAKNALVWLQESDRSDRAIHRVAVAIARCLRRFHDSGGYHRDLHLENILIDDASSPPRCWLIDLGRSRQVATLAPRERMRDIMRLVRSIEKSNPSLGPHASLQAGFLSAYCARDRCLRRALRASAPREVRRIKRHRLAWRLRRSLFVALVCCVALGCSEPITDAASAAVPRDVPETRLSLLATGDTGRILGWSSLFEGQLAVADALTREARANPVDGLILLGDNFYWHGLDRAHLVERIRENLVRPYCYFLDLGGPRSREVESSCGEPGPARKPVPIYAVLGNHDLELPESAQLQREVVPEFLPGWKMGRSIAEAVELSEGVSLVLFESELAIDDQALLESQLTRAIRSARGPWRILVAHRPHATDDLGRPAIGGYPGWVRTAIANARRPVQLALAGHHHNLQAFVLEAPTPMLAIGAGSGSRATPPLATNQPESVFGSIELGFARIDLVGRGEHERLAVSLFRTPRWPILSRLQAYSRVARFEVDRTGSVSAPES